MNPVYDQISRHAEGLQDEALALAAAVLKRALRQKKEAQANV
ncbi:hypothetical protein [Paracoccus fontiphilus]|uniref:Uncharacterized protein n=1 Tax=Paracoccus fontiphilus TaxID=1815556 RepID=A0ABV7ILT8_9RHOB|nr:hypothetical protein [Paracoccus fontiphilus]